MRKINCQNSLLALLFLVCDAVWHFENQSPSPSKELPCHSLMRGKEACRNRVWNLIAVQSNHCSRDIINNPCSHLDGVLFFVILFFPRFLQCQL
ncbi:hypothetical protein QBC43DRAFT_326882 [Cladorrhinum sp. PSN259]|nr:hypothetical protein QBC43DRAFT_326882 [Cladorrhinum sp. PSN259]